MCIWILIWNLHGDSHDILIHVLLIYVIFWCCILIDQSLSYVLCNFFFLMFCLIQSCLCFKNCMTGWATVFHIFYMHLKISLDLQLIYMCIQYETPNYKKNYHLYNTLRFPLMCWMMIYFVFLLPIEVFIFYFYVNESQRHCKPLMCSKSFTFITFLILWYLDSWFENKWNWNKLD